MRYDFASDNTAGICPQVWAAMEAANRGYIAPYGEDAWTARAADMLRELFETDCEVFFVFNGTAANSLALATLCQSYHSVICHEHAHVERDECGAPEFFSNGTKILLAGGAHGKLDPADVERLITQRSDLHYPKPRVISLTQATELGSVYTPGEIAALGALAAKHKLAVHMDGARFANAAAFLDLPPAEFTWKAGVDVLCFGGTKNGMAVGDAVIFFRREFAEEFEYRCKQAGQLCSKMRYLAAPWVGMLENDVWLENGRHANAMARRLADRLAVLPGVRIIGEVQANSVFLEMHPAIARDLEKRGWAFYNFIGENGYRFMCSWQTTEAEIEALVADLRACVVSA